MVFNRRSLCDLGEVQTFGNGAKSRVGEEREGGSKPFARSTQDGSGDLAAERYRRLPGPV